MNFINGCRANVTGDCWPLFTTMCTYLQNYTIGASLFAISQDKGCEQLTQ